jgi:molybdate transport system substrate-binding protein
MRMLLVIALICFLIVPSISAEEITIAAAADSSMALFEIAANYQKQTGNHVRLVFGASGNLYSQIQNGAPFDVFLSADLGYPKKLAEAGLIDPGSLFTYAVGRLVIWVPANSSLSLEKKGMEALLDPSVKKIALANPEHAPYGRAAVAALKKLGLYDKVKDRMVFGENVSQAAQFVESGNADAGIVALSHALAPAMNERGRYWELPADTYPELEQGAAIVSHSAHKKEAAAFLAYLKSPAALDVLKRYGFSTPGAAR